jgi:hypothetical protein
VFDGGFQPVAGYQFDFLFPNFLEATASHSHSPHLRFRFFSFLNSTLSDENGHSIDASPGAGNVTVTDSGRFARHAGA